MINRLNAEKLYLQIARAIEIDIQDSYEPGDVYLTEIQLAARFGVNRHTVRHAVDELVMQNRLVKRHGLGTFVAEKRMGYRIKSHQRLSQSLGEHALNFNIELIGKNWVEAQGSVQEKLLLSRGDQVLQIDTLRYIDYKPVAVISHFIAHHCANKVMCSYQGGSLGTFLTDECDAIPKRLGSQISSVVPNSQDAFLLKLASLQPLLKVKTLSIDAKTLHPLEYSITRFRGDSFEIEVDIPEC